MAYVLTYQNICKTSYEIVWIELLCGTSYHMQNQIKKECKTLFTDKSNVFCLNLINVLMRKKQ